MTNYELIKFGVFYPIMVILAFIGFMFCVERVIDKAVENRLEVIQEQQSAITTSESICVCQFKSQK